MESGNSRLASVALLALRLGATAFGGPAAHIAMLRDETVERRRWLSDREFVDLLGATNLIPGPNSTEMMMHIGALRAGWKGVVIAGWLFILPAALLVGGFAWMYETWHTTPAAGWFLAGIKPAVVVIIAQAVVQLARTALRDRLTIVAAAGVMALALAGVNEIALLFGTGALFMALRAGRRTLVALPFAAVGIPAAAAAPAPLLQIFLVFLKIGAVLYGSGYVLIAFLREDVVAKLGWITDQQLLDAVAIGQFTPGPISTTATFIGYLAGGWIGAVVATLGMFLPSFAFVLLTHRLVARMRASRVMGALLDGVGAAAVALMAAVALQLGRAAITGWVGALIAAASAIALFRFRVNSALVLAGAALAGAIAAWIS